MIDALALAYPSALLLLPAAIWGLVYIYRKRGNAIRRTISSALFVRMLEQRKAKRTRFKPPLRFLVELLLFSLLAIGAAGLLLDSQKQHIVLLVDNSLSMATIDIGVVPAQTRLEKAKERAYKALESRNYFTEVSIWKTSPSLSPVHTGRLSVSAARSKIDELAQGVGADRIEQALQRVLQSAGEGEVIVFTDKVPDSTSDATRVHVETIRDEKRAQNIALLGVTRSRGERAGRENISAKVHSYASRVAAVDVIVSRLDLVASKINSQKIRQVRIELTAGEERDVPFENLVEGDSYKFELRSVDDSLDMLREDNLAWVVGTKKSDVIGYVGDADPRSLGLTNAGHLQIVPLKELTEMPIFSVFYGVDVPDDYEGNALGIMPPGRELVQGSKLSVYDETHPLTSYISFPALTLSAVRPLDVPDWAQSVIETTAGTILYAGTREGSKRVIYGYDPLPYLGKKAPLRSILILNTFKWLSEKNVSLQSSVPGVRIRDEGVRMSYDDGSALSKSGDSYVAERTGLVHTPNVVVDAVNFFDPNESAPEQGTFAIPPTGVTRSSEEPLSGAPLSRTLALIVFALLLLDVFFFEVRKRIL